MGSVTDTVVLRVVDVEARRAFMTKTSIRHTETQVACIMKAPKSLGDEPRISLKRESSPSADMRANR
jgi:hypothetical protein